MKKPWLQIVSPGFQSFLVLPNLYSLQRTPPKRWQPLPQRSALPTLKGTSLRFPPAARTTSHGSAATPKNLIRPDLTVVADFFLGGSSEAPSVCAQGLSMADKGPTITDGKSTPAAEYCHHDGRIEGETVVARDFPDREIAPCG